jgi:phosphoglycolate phosphatase-like HAD superfamily hydrolase
LSRLSAAGRAIVLFDIDGTLIRTGRAGSRAMNRAFDDLFGIADAFDGIQMAGRTDKWILDDAAARAGVDLSGGNFERFQRRYFERLAEALPEPAPEKGVLPGVQNLLETIDARDDIFVGLLTGNCEQGARLKLEHFDLWKFFRGGAYGDDVADRNHLFDVALQRAEACGWSRVPPQDVVIVGDTVLDVECARAAGARSVAVATGPSDVDTLRHNGADLVLRDLTDAETFLRFVFVQT